MYKNKLVLLLCNLVDHFRHLPREDVNQILQAQDHIKTSQTTNKTQMARHLYITIT